MEGAIGDQATPTGCGHAFRRLLGLLALAGALAGVGAGCDSRTHRTVQLTATEQRTAAIYASVIRQLATTDNTFGGDPSVFKHLFVVDGVVPAGHEQVTQAFDAGVKARIAERIADLPPLEFVTDPHSVIGSTKGCATVKEHGALISLGAITKARANRVTVRGQLFFACLGGAGATYLLEARNAPVAHRRARRRNGDLLNAEPRRLTSNRAGEPRSQRYSPGPRATS